MIETKQFEANLSALKPTSNNPRHVQKAMKKLGLVIAIPKEAYELGMCEFREGIENYE